MFMYCVRRFLAVCTIKYMLKKFNWLLQEIDRWFRKIIFGNIIRNLFLFWKFLFVHMYLRCISINLPHQQISLRLKYPLQTLGIFFRKEIQTGNSIKRIKLFSRINQSNALLFLFLWQRIVCHDVLLVCKFISVYTITYFVYFVFSSVVQTCTHTLSSDVQLQWSFMFSFYFRIFFIFNSIIHFL